MNGYKGNKIHENALTKCDKCDCLIVSDSSDSKNDECINPRSLNYGDKHNQRYGEVENDHGSIVCQNPVKIVLENGDSSSTGKTPSDSDNCECHSLKSDFAMKHVCFRFCRKKKDKTKTDAAPDAEQKQAQDNGNQTSTVAVPDKKDDLTIGQGCPAMEPHINEIIKKCACKCKPGGGGGCNTNTIIFPREKICGASLLELENCIKTEARANTRHFEEIISELYKQKREVREVRDLLDLMVRTMREHFCTSAANNNQKAYLDVFEDFCKKTCLERKSNSLSMVEPMSKQPSPNEIEVPQFSGDNVEDPTTDEPAKPKKKGLFSCFG